MDLETRKRLVAQYKEGYRLVADAVAGATDAELDARPAPGKWTAREIVHHLADSEMTSAVRLRMLLAADKPAIVGYDQEAFARKLHYNRPITAAMAALKAARETTAELIDRMTEADWQREGTHTEHGRYGVDTWIGIYGPHAHDHAKQILRARASGKN